LIDVKKRMVAKYHPILMLCEIYSKNPGKQKPKSQSFGFDEWFDRYQNPTQGALPWGVLRRLYRSMPVYSPPVRAFARPFLSRIFPLLMALDLSFPEKWVKIGKKNRIFA